VAIQSHLAITNDKNKTLRVNYSRGFITVLTRIRERCAMSPESPPLVSSRIYSFFYPFFLLYFSPIFKDREFLTT